MEIKVYMSDGSEYVIKYESGTAFRRDVRSATAIIYAGNRLYLNPLHVVKFEEL